jgi:hypothetical protein
MRVRAVSPIRLPLMAVCLAAATWSAGAQGIHWYDDYNAARAEAHKTGKPIFLAFRCSP